MNYFIFIACNLITINTIFAMTNDSKITIYNRNCDVVTIHFTYYNTKTHEELSTSANKVCRTLFIDSQQLHRNEQQQFALEIPSKFLRLQPILQFQKTNPREFFLPVGIDGSLSYGDTLTIEKNKKYITITDQNKKIIAALPKTNKSLIGNGCTII